MANKFAEIAKKETSLSRIMEGRTKVTQESIMQKFPDGVTVTEFDFLTVNDPKKGVTTFPVLTIAEEPTLCFFGGAILSKICAAWASACDGDAEQASEELKAAGGCKMKFVNSRTKSGNNITLVEIVE